jgi:hypothetical protein
MTNKRSRKSVQMPPPNPLLVGRELERAVVRRHAAKHLQRGGGPQRVLAEIARGTDPKTATEKTAAIAKGHLAELKQAAEFTVDSGLSGLPWRAQPSPAANDTLIDVEILDEGGELVHGAQIKVGHHRYVSKAICEGRYGMFGVPVVANGEARQACALTEQETGDRLEFRGAEARPMRAEHLEAEVSEALWLCFEDQAFSSQFEGLRAAARAGGSDALFWFTAELSRAACNGELKADGWRPVVERALAVAGKAGARTALQTALLLCTFDARARENYSAGLVHELAVRSHVAGAAAGVLVEATCDFYRYWQGELSRDELLRRIVVNTTSASGAALGAYAGMALSRGQPAWLRWLAAVGLGLVGGELGRALGEHMVASDPGTS